MSKDSDAYIGTTNASDFETTISKDKKIGWNLETKSEFKDSEARNERNELIHRISQIKSKALIKCLV